MALAADHSSLPVDRPPTVEGHAPDVEPRFIGVLAETWAEDKAAGDSPWGSDDKPTALGTRIRHSDAGKCARAIGYKAVGIPRSDPMDLTGVWNTTLGSVLHDMWQGALRRRYPDADVEVKVGHDSLDASGHIDAVITIPIPYDDEKDADHRPTHGEGGPDRDVLALDRSDDPERVRGDRSGEARRGDRAGASGDVRAREGSDPGRAPDRPPLSGEDVREPGAHGTGDPRGEHSTRDGVVGDQRGQDPLPEGAPVRQGEHLRHADGIEDVPGVRAGEEPSRPRTTTTVAYELKTVGGYGFKAAVGKIRKSTPAEGPKLEHVLQAGLNARALGADQAVVGYLAKECISVNVGAGMEALDRFAAEWTFTRDEFDPLVDAEIARLQGILDLVDEGSLPARKFPAGLIPARAEIVDPIKGRWEEKDAAGGLVDTGTFWACGYCDYRTTCAATKRGRIPVADVEALVTATTEGEAEAAYAADEVGF